MRNMVYTSLMLAVLLTACRRVPLGRVYVTSEGSGDMTVIDPVSQEVVATVSLGKRPRGMVVSQDGTLIYVALSGEPFAPPGVDESTLPPPDKNADGIGVFDIRQNKMIRFISGGQNAERLAMSKDGQTFYVAKKDVAGLSFVDVASGKTLATLPVGEEADGTTVSPDGTFVYATSETDGTVTQIDTATRHVVKQINACKGPRTVICTHDGTRVLVACQADGSVLVLDAVRLEPLETIQLGKGQLPMGMVLTRDGAKLYVTTGRAKKVFAIDMATNKVLTSFAVGGQRPWGVALSPDERFLYTANGPSNDVSVVDLAAQTEVKRIKTGDRPWGALTVAPR